MYVSPSVWNKMVGDKWKICVYLDGQGKNFHYINNAEEFLKLVEKDDVVIKITGKGHHFFCPPEVVADGRQDKAIRRKYLSNGIRKSHL